MDERKKAMQATLEEAFKRASLELNHEEQQTLAEAMLTGDLHALVEDIKWQISFSNSQDTLENLADQAMAEHKSGLTEEGGWQE